MTSRSSSVSRPHFSLTLPLNCFQFPSNRFQSMTHSYFFSSVSVLLIATSHQMCRRSVINQSLVTGAGRKRFLSAALAAECQASSSIRDRNRSRLIGRRLAHDDYRETTGPCRRSTGPSLVAAISLALLGDGFGL